jgi:hypothetical protein
MAARTNRVTLNESWRQKIKVSMLINRLQNHADGEVEMSATQIRAAEILLNKSLPNLSQATLDAGEGMQTLIFDMLGRDHKD